jgi:hypothetical protein
MDREKELNRGWNRINADGAEGINRKELIDLREWKRGDLTQRREDAKKDKNSTSHGTG